MQANVWAKTDGRCWYCGEQTNPFIDFAMDHVLPVRQGGTDDLSNRVPACQPCNSRKRDKTLEEFRASTGQDTFWFEREGLQIQFVPPSSPPGFYTLTLIAMILHTGGTQAQTSPPAPRDPQLDRVVSFLAKYQSVPMSRLQQGVSSYRIRKMHLDSILATLLDQRSVRIWKKRKITMVDWIGHP